MDLRRRRGQKGGYAAGGIPASSIRQQTSQSARLLSYIEGIERRGRGQRPRGGASGASEPKAGQKGGYQVARIRGIQAKHIGDILTLKINGTDAVSYSPLNYCKNVLNGATTDEKLINVVKALYAYWQEADKYFQS